MKAAVKDKLRPIDMRNQHFEPIEISKSLIYMDFLKFKSRDLSFIKSQ
jgi:hypothetical protein